MATRVFNAGVVYVISHGVDIFKYYSIKNYKGIFEIYPHIYIKIT